jgi:hypothetical protein
LKDISEHYKEGRVVTLESTSESFMLGPNIKPVCHSRTAWLAHAKGKQAGMSTLSIAPPDEQVVQIIHDEGARLALALLLGTTHCLVIDNICRIAVAAAHCQHKYQNTPNMHAMQAAQRKRSCKRQ